MKIHGFYWNEVLIAAMLGITLGLFTVLPMSPHTNPTLGGSIFGPLELPLEKNEK